MFGFCHISTLEDLCKYSYISWILELKSGILRSNLNRGRAFSITDQIFYSFWAPDILHYFYLGDRNILKKSIFKSPPANPFEKIKLNQRLAKSPLIYKYNTSSYTIIYVNVRFFDPHLK